MTTTGLKALFLVFCSLACLFGSCKRSQISSETLDQELIHAAQSGDKDSVQEALERGAHIEAKNQ